MYPGDHDKFIQEFKERTLFMRDECHVKLNAVPGMKFRSKN